MSFQRLRRRLYEAVGLGFALVPAMHACGGTAVIDGEDGSGGATSSSGSGGTTSTSSVSSSSGLDVASSTGVGGTDCVQTGSTGSGVMEVMHCLQSGQPCPQGDLAFQAINEEIWSSCCINDISCDALTDVLCGPYPTTLGPCCYQIMTEETTCATPGRPLAGAFGDLLAGTARRPGWSQGTGAASARAYWLAEARGEHASIASFLRHASELLALGAPPALVAAAFRAARDEVAHARLAFGLASTEGAPAAPAALHLEELSGRCAHDLSAFAAATVAEGCINETLALVDAMMRLERCEDPAERAALSQIVEDETRHAELAWQTVAWAVAAGGAPTARAVEGAFARQAWDHLGMAEVIAPCAEALLAG